MFEKETNINFHENPYSGSRVVPREWTNGRRDMTMLIVAFRNFCERASKRKTVNQNCAHRVHKL